MILGLGFFSSCAVIPLFEIDVIAVDVSSGGTLNGITVTFRATLDNGDLYDWDFGDGGTGTGQIVSHIYMTEGQYLVRLEITSNGRTLVYSRVVDIIANFGGSTPSGPLPGQIEDAIGDFLEFDTTLAQDPNIIQVGNGIFAVAYNGGSNSDGLVTTFSIDPSGNVGDSPIDTFAFEPTFATADPKIFEVGPGIYAIAYSRGLVGYVVTIDIDAGGTIGTALIDSQQFSTRAIVIQPIEVGSGIYAFAYAGTDDDGYVSTLSIAADGTISNSVIETVEFLDSDAFTRDIIQVGPGLYAITYDFDFDGYVVTIGIDAAGDIDAALTDSLEFAPIRGFTPNIIEVGTGVYASAYQGPDNDGFVTTFSIDSSGSIANSVIDNLNLKPLILGVGQKLWEWAVMFMRSPMKGQILTDS